MSEPFDVKPKHWWTWLNPRWYVKRRILRALLKHQWEESGLEKKMLDKIKQHYLYGDPL